MKKIKTNHTQMKKEPIQKETFEYFPAFAMNDKEIEDLLNGATLHEKIKLAENALQRLRHSLNDEGHKRVSHSHANVNANILSYVATSIKVETFFLREKKGTNKG